MRFDWSIQLYFPSAMRHEHDWSNMVACIQVVRIYSFVMQIKLCIRASYIVFLFVKTENNNFINSMFTSPAFTDQLSNSPKRLPWFLLGYKGTV